MIGIATIDAKEDLLSPIQDKTTLILLDLEVRSLGEYY
jgi:hypothetical protein